MKEKIIGVIPNVVLESRPKINFYLVFMESLILVATDREMDSMSINSPVGMWPASGAVIDSVSPANRLGDFTKKLEKRKGITEIDLENLKDIDMQIDYNDIKSIVLENGDDSASITINYKESLKFIVYEVDSELMEEYREMLSSLFGKRLTID